MYRLGNCFIHLYFICICICVPLTQSLRCLRWQWQHKVSRVVSICLSVGGSCRGLSFLRSCTPDSGKTPIFTILILEYSAPFHHQKLWIFVCIVFWYKYIQEKNLTCALKSPKVKWLKLFTHRLIYTEKLLPLCCVNYVLTFCCITHLKSNI